MGVSGDYREIIGVPRLSSYTGQASFDAGKPGIIGGY